MFASNHVTAAFRLGTLCAMIAVGAWAAWTADPRDERDANPLRLEPLVHGTTELFSFLVSQPVHDGRYGREGSCDLVMTLRNVGAKFINDLDQIAVTARDQGGHPIQVMLVNQPQSIANGGVTTWQIRLLPKDPWPESVTLQLRSHKEAFVSFDFTTPSFKLLRSPE
ncbi:MAG: hypothetical protein ACK5OB_01705 [Pirellula sp.]